MQRTLCAVGLAALCLTWAASASAGAVAPSKPSQLVTLETGGTACTGLTGAFSFGTRVLGDGTTTSFTIPAGQVLVLDRVTWVTNGGTAGGAGSVGLVIEGASTALLWGDFAPNDGQGDTGRSVALPNIPIKSGHTVCVKSTSPSTVNAITELHGFLTKDN